MIKKIGVVLFCVISMGLPVFILAACDKPEQQETNEEIERISEGIREEKAEIMEYIDNETGVHYLIYRESVYKGASGGITPRYNADGSLYTDKKVEKGE